ncbi:MAG: MAPEG family protein [Caulobacteraceae bacterium]
MTIEIQFLIYSAILALVQMAAQGAMVGVQHGGKWALGPRDESKKLEGRGGRIERAFRNFMETYPIFVALVFAAYATNNFGQMTAWGVQLYLFGRIAYWFAYVFGWAYIRSLLFGVSAAGLVLLLIGVLS